MPYTKTKCTCSATAFPWPICLATLATDSSVCRHIQIAAHRFAHRFDVPCMWAPCSWHDFKFRFMTVFPLSGWQSWIVPRLGLLASLLHQFSVPISVYFAAPHRKQHWLVRGLILSVLLSQWLCTRLGGDYIPEDQHATFSHIYSCTQQKLIATRSVLTDGPESSERE